MSVRLFPYCFILLLAAFALDAPGIKSKCPITAR